MPAPLGPAVPADLPQQAAEQSAGLDRTQDQGPVLPGRSLHTPQGRGPPAPPGPSRGPSETAGSGAQEVSSGSWKVQAGWGSPRVGRAPASDSPDAPAQGRPQGPSDRAEPAFGTPAGHHPAGPTPRPKHPPPQHPTAGLGSRETPPGSRPSFAYRWCYLRGPPGCSHPRPALRARLGGHGL